MTFFLPPAPGNLSKADWRGAAPGVICGKTYQFCEFTEIRQGFGPGVLYFHTPEKQTLLCTEQSTERMRQPAQGEDTSRGKDRTNTAGKLHFTQI